MGTRLSEGEAMGDSLMEQIEELRWQEKALLDRMARKPVRNEEKLRSLLVRVRGALAVRHTLVQSVRSAVTGMRARLGGGNELAT